MDIAFSLTPGREDHWHLAAQMGITHAVGMYPRPLAVDEYPLWDPKVCAGIKDMYEAKGFELSVIEGRWIGVDHIRLGTVGRDAEIEKVIAAVKNLGEVGIPVWCYNWLTYFGARRTERQLAIRGGALATGYSESQDIPIDGGVDGIISEKHLWENYEYFLAKIIPVAEKAGVKMALHPDDPPLPVVAGVPRIFSSVADFERAFDLYDSEAHGVCFCQANFALMGADIPETIEKFGKAGRLHFVHFRDIRGAADDFVETFHDNGQTDMLAAMQAYSDIGFKGVMRPDHAPSMWGETNGIPGYEAMGKIHAVGYMTGLQEQLKPRSVSE